MTEPGFTVIDRRGEARIEEEPPKIIEPESPKAPTGSKRVWTSQALIITLAPAGPQGFFVIGRAVGERQDGLLAVADYLLSAPGAPLWDEKKDWVKEARRRLNTFLGCECTMTLQCNLHREVIRNWVAEDSARVNKIGAQAVPHCIELLAKVEQARRNPAIVIPR